MTDLDCPNRQLSAHREQVIADYRGRCSDCGRQLRKVAKLHRSRYGKNRGRTYATQISYNGAPE